MKVGRVARARVAPLLDQLKADGLDVNFDEGEWIGAVDGDRVLGVARLFDKDGIHVVDDLWVEPTERTRGVASAIIAEAKARRRPLWLICDEDQTGFYARRGFEAVPLEEFPKPLAEHYASKGEWPEASDHKHLAFRWE